MIDVTDVACLPVRDVRVEPFGLADVTTYRRQGLLALRGLVEPAELAILQDAAASLVDWAWTARQDLDVQWSGRRRDPTSAPTRIEYVVDKSDAVRNLAGHPALLEVVEAIVGPNFLPTWDSLVFKTAEGAPRIDWHRDDGIYRDPLGVLGSGRVVDVGVYLDHAPPSNCVWAIPGSNYWDAAAAEAETARRNAVTWDPAGAVPAVLEPGDVLFHNVMTVHGAPAVERSRRRVVYFEYRPAELERERGPHTPEYVTLKQRVLQWCIAERRAAWPDEQPFVYRPADAVAPAGDDPGELASLRFAHHEHWTWTDDGEPGPVASQS